MSDLQNVDPQIFNLLQDELNRQVNKIQLIASENYTSPTILAVQATVLTNKYAEGYPQKRYYQGCEYVDGVEQLAIDRAKQLFGAEHVNVQPHSGSQANQEVYITVLDPGDTVLGMNLAHGGHLTHGSPVSFSGKFYNFISYGVKRDTEQIDWDQLQRLAKEQKPKLIVVGASAYPRIIDFSRVREIADEVDAYVMADIAHIAGLVVAGKHPSPVPYCEFVTTTTHKTLRGPRGGIILCREAFAQGIDKAVFPGMQGGPLMHVIAAKAVAFKEAATPEFKQYQRRIVENARAMAEKLMSNGFRLVSGGTDNHLMLIDLTPQGLTGKDAALALDKAGITANKNEIPFDTKSPRITSGVRLGTPAVTTRGMKQDEMRLIADLITRVLKNIGNEEIYKQVRQESYELCSQFPVYKELKA